jgi:hypothetical protein
MGEKGRKATELPPESRLTMRMEDNRKATLAYIIRALKKVG